MYSTRTGKWTRSELIALLQAAAPAEEDPEVVIEYGELGKGDGCPDGFIDRDFDVWPADDATIRIGDLDPARKS